MKRRELLHLFVGLFAGTIIKESDPVAFPTRPLSTPAPTPTPLLPMVTAEYRGYCYAIHIVHNGEVGGEIIGRAAFENLICNPQDSRVALWHVSSDSKRIGDGNARNLEG